MVLKSREALHKFEVHVTVAQVLILFFFSAVQLFGPFRSMIKSVLNYMIKVDGIDRNEAGIFLQVDATILTLTIAILAILGGLISKSHMGLNYCDYFLNIRPRIYKQIRLILLSLIYFFFACFFFAIHLNYLVTALLFCEILLIIMSAISIYGIFGGDKEIKNEITEFSISTQIGNVKRLDCTNKNNNTKRNAKARAKRIKDKQEIEGCFVRAFSKVLVDGRLEDYEEYASVLDRIIDYAWSNRGVKESAYSLNRLEKNCIVLLDACASSSSYNSKILYLRLVKRIYDRIYTLIYEEKENEKVNVLSIGKRCTFNIVSSYSFCYDILKSVSIEDFENNICISDLLYRILLTEFVLDHDYINDVKRNDKKLDHNGWIPSETVNDIQSHLGLYLAGQVRRGKCLNNSYWSEEYEKWYGIINFKYLGSYNDESKKSFADAIAHSGINYACGLLSNGQFDIIKNGLYLRRLNSIPDCDDTEIKIVLSVHAYLYYMAWRENQEDVGVELQKKARDFVFDPEISSVFRQFLATSGVAEVLIDNMRTEWKREGNNRVLDPKSRELNRMLRKFDLRTIGKHFRIIIISDVLDDFFFFTLFYLYYHHMAELDWLGDNCHNMDDYVQYITDYSRNSVNEIDEFCVKKRVKDYYEFLYADMVFGKKVEPSMRGKILDESERFYICIINSLKTKYKEYRMEEADKRENAFSERIDSIDDLKQRWFSRISHEVKRRFGSLICFDQECKMKYIEYNLLKYSTFSDSIPDDLDDNDMETIVSELMDSYIEMLKGRRCIKHKNKRIDYPEDRDYIQYLNDNHLDLLMGNASLLGFTELKVPAFTDEITKAPLLITSSVGKYGVALKQRCVEFYIKCINVSIRNALPTDENIHRFGGKLSYEPVLGVSLDFSENEFSEYISKERKVIEVNAQIGIKIKLDEVDDAGVYFQRSDLVGV